MDIGVLASLRAFKTPPMSSPRNDHIRGTAANIHSVGFISRGLSSGLPRSSFLVAS